MKVYIIPSVAINSLVDSPCPTVIASLVPAMNKEEALGRLLMNMKNRFPEKDGWIHLIGDIGDDSTEEIKALAERL